VFAISSIINIFLISLSEISSISNFSVATLNFSFVDLIFLISFQGFTLKDFMISILFSAKYSCNKIKKLHFLSTEYGTKIIASYFLEKSSV
jgi:hypothetical protein